MWGCGVSATPMHDDRGQCQAVLVEGGKVRRWHWAEAAAVEGLNLSLKNRSLFPGLRFIVFSFGFFFFNFALL